MLLLTGWLSTTRTVPFRVESSDKTKVWPAAGSLHRWVTLWNACFCPRMVVAFCRPLPSLATCHTSCFASIYSRVSNIPIQGHGQGHLTTSTATFPRSEATPVWKWSPWMTGMRFVHSTCLSWSLPWKQLHARRHFILHDCNCMWGSFSHNMMWVLKTSIKLVFVSSLSMFQNWREIITKLIFQTN